MLGRKTNMTLSQQSKAIGLLILLVAVCAGGYFIYKAVSSNQNQQNFIQTRVAIDIIYADIADKAGQPDNFKSQDYCAKSISAGNPLTCHVTDVFVYGVNGEAAANKQFQKIQKIISSHGNVLAPTRPLSKAITDQFVVDTAYHAASDRYTSHSLQCVVNYVYDTPSEISLSIKNPAQMPLQVTVDCYGPANDQYYPLASS